MAFFQSRCNMFVELLQNSCRIALPRATSLAHCQASAHHRLILGAHFRIQTIDILALQMVQQSPWLAICGSSSHRPEYPPMPNLQKNKAEAVVIVFQSVTAKSEIVWMVVLLQL